LFKRFDVTLKPRRILSHQRRQAEEEAGHEENQCQALHEEADKGR
jgi:hypothetical protein